MTILARDALVGVVYLTPKGRALERIERAADADPEDDTVPFRRLDDGSTFPLAPDYVLTPKPVEAAPSRVDALKGQRIDDVIAAVVGSVEPYVSAPLTDDELEELLASDTRGRVQRAIEEEGAMRAAGGRPVPAAVEAIMPAQPFDSAAFGGPVEVKPVGAEVEAERSDPFTAEVEEFGAPLVSRPAPLKEVPADPPVGAGATIYEMLATVGGMAVDRLREEANEVADGESAEIGTASASGSHGPDDGATVATGPTDDLPWPDGVPDVNRNRRAEVLGVWFDGQPPRWREFPFVELRTGDYYRIFEEDGTPVDGGRVYLAKSNAFDMAGTGTVIGKIVSEADAIAAIAALAAAPHESGSEPAPAADPSTSSTPAAAHPVAVHASGSTTATTGDGEPVAAQEAAPTAVSTTTATKPAKERPRGYCVACRQLLTVRADGTMMAHFTPDGAKGPDGKRIDCQGVGLTPASERPPEPRLPLPVAMGVEAPAAPIIERPVLASPSTDPVIAEAVAAASVVLDAPAVAEPAPSIPRYVRAGGTSYGYSIVDLVPNEPMRREDGAVAVWEREEDADAALVYVREHGELPSDVVEEAPAERAPMFDRAWFTREADRIPPVGVESERPVTVAKDATDNRPANPIEALSRLVADAQRAGVRVRIVIEPIE